MSTLELSDYLTTQTVRVQVEAGNWASVIEQAGQLLLNTGKIEPRYIEAMKAILEVEGPYMVIAPGIALLHARPHDGALGECLSLITLAAPVDFGNPENDPVTLAIAFAAGEADTHIQILGQLAQLLADEERVDQILRAAEVQEVLTVLQNRQPN